ncbi:glutamine--fructose-6-phosphate transaminase (isomerizing) [Bacillota bacterium LX-D]|nr:glutamine--fructose-6-phosphate transaminase (isomerizing) [Bacillota bacterium LX-D]
MCGIVGYLGSKEAAPILLEGLSKLEYRGYDSAGIAVLKEDALELAKSVGRLKVLEDFLADKMPTGTIGIGHTRWATHGRPSDLNAHPHTGCSEDFVVVHNGIIENYQKLKEWLLDQGHTFSSETDTEVLPHLIEHYYQGDLVAAVQNIIPLLEGSYALVAMTAKEPNKLVAARKDSPLVVGLGEKEYFIASDIPAILNYTRETYILEDGEMAVLTAKGVAVCNTQNEQINKEIFHVKWDIQAAERGGYAHFMLKEINEQPQAIKETITGRIDEKGQVDLGLSLSTAEIKKFEKIAVVACGTAYHAGLVGKYVIEKMLRIPVEVDVASEFRYRDPLINEKTLVLVISQSGETADTLAALREAKARKAKVLAITNVVGSSVSREADEVIYTWAGPEIAVASTKAYITQLIAIYLLALYLAQNKESIDTKESAELAMAIKDLPHLAETMLQQAEKIESWAKQIAQRNDAFFIGRGLDYAVALEGSLKLKEISYIHAEAYAAGELKHGTLALIEEGIPVISLLTQEKLYDKMVSNIKEVKARGACVTAVTFKNHHDIEQVVDEVIYLPQILPVLAPVLTVIPLQLLAYYASIARGNDVDKPRNLAKSVTVE